MDLWHWLIGPPIKAREAEREAIGTPEGLAALSLDALSSVAYGPEAIAVVLVTAGSGALVLLLPVSTAIVCLLALLIISYRQVISAYPNGGGAYAVSRDNLGAKTSLVAGASLIVDYILTVAVSIAAGVAAMTSAFPVLAPHTVSLALLILAVIVYFNLRGVGESARAFLLPAVIFIGGIFTVIGLDLLHPAATSNFTPAGTMRAAGTLLFLRAFAAGCSALTGIEAIANGVPLFREPKVERAQRTIVLLGVFLGAMLLGLAWVTIRLHLEPKSGETLLSQIMTVGFGRGPLYDGISFTVTIVLALAANTSFSGLPLLAGVLANDNYLPHIFGVRGDRLVFVYGIWFLAFTAGLLLFLVGGDTLALIPLYAIGVFTGFTISQSGLVVHWWQKRPEGWKGRLILNGLGALVTGIATLVFIVTKFREGAWVVIVAIPLMVWLFGRIHAYYLSLEHQLAFRRIPPPVSATERPLVIVPFAEISRLTARALQEALAISDDVIAVTVALEPGAEAMEQRVQAVWDEWKPPVRLVVLHSQFQSIVRPLARYIGTLERRAKQRVMVLIPEVVPRGLGQNFLHNQIGIMLAASLRRRTDVIVSVMPMHPEEEAAEAPSSRRSGAGPLGRTAESPASPDDG